MEVQVEGNGRPAGKDAGRPGYGELAGRWNDNKFLVLVIFDGRLASSQYQFEDNNNHIQIHHAILSPQGRAVLEPGTLLFSLLKEDFCDLRRESRSTDC